MQPGRLTCPNCSAPLRVRDRRLIGRQVDCPDCAAPMLVMADGHRDLALRAVDSAAKQPVGTAVVEQPVTSASEMESKRSDRLSRMLPWWDALKSPVGVAWTVAGVVALAFAALLLPGDDDNPPPKPATNQLAATESPAAEETEGTAPATWRQPVGESVPPKPSTQPPSATHGAIPDAPGSVTETAAQHADRPLPDVPDDGLFVAEVDTAPPVAAPQPLADVPEDDAASPDEQQPAAEPVDVEAALAQPIVRFRQTRPAAARDLLLQIEEMAGVPIESDQGQLGAEYARLAEKVSLELENTTVGQILDALLEQFDWSADVRDGKVYLVPAAR